MQPTSLTSSSHLCEFLPRLQALTRQTSRSLQSRAASLRISKESSTCSASISPKCFTATSCGSPMASMATFRANSALLSDGLQRSRFSGFGGQTGQYRRARTCMVGAEAGESGRRMSDQPPQEAVLKAISEVSKMEGRDAKTTIVAMGGTESPYGSDWLELDKKVNTYPSLRGFTAIGTGGSDFVQAMVVAVESVLLEPIPQGQVRHRESAQGRYISVKIGPMRVESSLQVRAIYQAMRRDKRMKYFL